MLNDKKKKESGEFQAEGALTRVASWEALYVLTSTLAKPYIIRLGLLMGGGLITLPCMQDPFT